MDARVTIGTATGTLHGRITGLDGATGTHPEWVEHLHGDADGLGAVRGMVFAVGAIMVAAALGAALWPGWDWILTHLAIGASTVADYFHTGPGCPGADYGWLGRCSQAPKGGL